MENINIQKVKENFDKIINDMELKTKEIFINNIKIKENLSSIKKIENKNNFLDDMLYDKKSELNILKQLIILKEQKKLNFDDIISKYLYQLMSINNRTNNKIDTLKRNNLLINKKQKIINKLLDNFNIEFNNCLNEEHNKKIKNKKNINNINDKKYFLSNVFSNGINKYIHKGSSSCKTKTTNNNFINGNNEQNKNIDLNNIILKKGEIEELSNDFQNYINKKKENKNDNKKDYTNFINIKPNNKINKNINNINIETFTIPNNKINFKANKNLQQSRENLKYLISQNDKEKINKKKLQKYCEFAKILFSKLKIYNINLNKIIFNKLKYFYEKVKLKTLFNNLYINKKNIIIYNIKEILQNTSTIYNEVINEEIINDDSFLNEIDLNQININDKQKKSSLNKFTNNLIKLKNINKEINDIENKIMIFTNNISQNN